MTISFKKFTSFFLESIFLIQTILFFPIQAHAQIFPPAVSPVLITVMPIIPISPSILFSDTSQGSWDAENRLVLIEPQSPLDGSMRVEFVYDYQGRRVGKITQRYTGGIWTTESTKYYVYDGWNVIEEETDGVDSRYFVWGLDLSGSLQGAGGIGGLLAMVDGSNAYDYLYDANGNVGQLVNSVTGTIAAHYEYDPYGSIITSTGALASSNPYRFSTKYFDPEYDLYYYGHRYYDPQIGRWLSRDPIAEQGGVNLYGFVRNSPLNYIDPIGRFSLLITFDPDIYSTSDSAIRKRQIETALSFDIVIGLAAGATYDNAVRVAYDAAEKKLLMGINKLVSRGVYTIEEGAREYVKNRNKLVIIFRERSSPVGKYIAEVMKPSNKLPAYKTLLDKKGNAKAILDSAKANQRVTKGISRAGKAGKVCIGISIGVSLYNVSVAEEGRRTNVAVSEVGGFTGSIGGAWVFGGALGKVGLESCGPKCGAVGAFIGTVVGGYLGGQGGDYIADKLFDAIVSE